MANIDIHIGKSVNGVAAIHTDILKQSELKDFYALYPTKFNNKTNGITFRRWLSGCNTQLHHYLCDLLKKDPSSHPEILKAVSYTHLAPRAINYIEKCYGDHHFRPIAYCFHCL